MLQNIAALIKLETTLARHLSVGLTLILALVVAALATLYYQKDTSSKAEIASSSSKLVAILKELEELKSQDQVKVNLKLNDEIKSIHDTYTQAISLYEKLIDLKLKIKNTQKFDKLFASSLKYLADRNYSSSSANLAELEKGIQEENTKLIPVVKPEANTPTSTNVSNTPPSGGYSWQSVQTDIGIYTVDIVSADLGSTKVIIDTASDSDCRDNCPVLSLGEYVARSGAFAGVNGSYFCPAEYPSCAGKTNSYDTLVMNKNKVYINSENNVYSTVPAAIFSSGGARFVGQSLQWGRDTGVDGVIANQPLLLAGGNIAFGGGSDPKQGSKGSRSFVGSKGSQIYIGVVHGATVAEVAHVLKALGLQEALNLDSGGSTALWSGGYKVGPGRNLPNTVLFVRR